MKKKRLAHYWAPYEHPNLKGCFECTKCRLIRYVHDGGGWVFYSKGPPKESSLFQNIIPDPGCTE